MFWGARPERIGHPVVKYLYKLLNVNKCSWRHGNQTREQSPRCLKRVGPGLLGGLFSK